MNHENMFRIDSRNLGTATAKLYRTIRNKEVTLTNRVNVRKTRSLNILLYFMKCHRHVGNLSEF